MQATDFLAATAGERLRSWRTGHGLSQSRLADFLNELLASADISRRTDDAQISRIERGIETPGLALATCIERLTGVPAASWVRVA